MYGYQPPAARRLAQTPEQYADGGLVARMKSADAGPAAFGSRGLSQLRDMVPQMAAMGYPQQAAAPAPAPAPVSDPRVAQLQAMIPKMEAMGFQKRPLTPQMLARGGMIRGPGTGTSDSIPDEMEPGTYIMPADSTRQLGLDDKKVPVRVSNGEYELPPEQVQAVGAAVLDAIKGVTHTPKSLSARGLQSPQDEQFFATGGSVRDPEELRKMIPQVEAMGYAQSPAAAPAPAAKDPLDGGAAFGVFPQLAGGKRTTYAMDEKLRTGVQATGPSTFVQATPLDKTIIGGGNGQRMNATQDPRSLLTATGMNAVAGVSPPPTPSPPGAAQPGSPAASASTGNPPDMGGNLPTPQPVGTSTAIAPGVYQHGRGQYSDNAAGMGMPAGFTGRPNAQNMAAADAMAGRSQQESMSRVMAQGFPGARGGPGSGPVEPGSFTGGYSGVVGSTSTYGNMRGRSPEQRLRDAEVSASSIMNRPKWGGRGAENSAAMLEYRAALQQDRDIRQNQAGADIEAQRQAAGIQREGMQQDGSTTRTGMTEQGANAREQGRNILARDEFNLKKEASSFQTRAAQQQEQLRNVLADPKATPAQRRQAQESLRALGVKVEDNRFTVVPGGQEWDATAGAMRNVPARVLNNQTGQFVDQGGGAQQGAAVPPGMTKQVGTSNGRPVYEDAKGNRFVG